MIKMDTFVNVYKNVVFVYLFVKTNSLTAEAVRCEATGTNNGFVLGIEPGGVHEPSGVENCFWLQ